MTAQQAGSVSAVERSALRELGMRIEAQDKALAVFQNVVLARLDAIGDQVKMACDSSAETARRTDDHETRIRLREQAYAERIEPAMRDLAGVRDQAAALARTIAVLEANVARSAAQGGMAGGGIITGIGVLGVIIAKAAGWL